MYKMSELIKRTAKELKELEDLLWADWEIVSKAHKVIAQIEEE